MIKMEDLKLIFAENCAQVRAEPTYISFLNPEEKKIMQFILGENWAKLIHSLSILELETIFYEKVPTCPDYRILGGKFF